MCIFMIFFLHILFKYASKVRATCIILPYNDGSKAPIRLSGRGRSCLAFVRSGMFGLGIAPKEKLSTQIRFRNKTCNWKSGYGRH